jgi:NADH-quinone oxidoreductase subunit I
MERKEGPAVIRALKGARSLLQGMGITFSYLFRKPITLQFPEKRAVMTLRFRGRLVLPIDVDKGETRCTACMRCVKICPNHSIDVEREAAHDRSPRPRPAKYLYNMGTCMFCNLCVEACPYFAIVMSDEHELAATGKGGLIIDLAAERHRLAGKKAAWWQKKFRGGEGE